MPPHNQEFNLVLSSDAKPRLKWTPELHRRFVDAVNQLGGPEKATPKSLMRIMGIHGLTLYHLKSHLQKYRLGRSQQSKTQHHIKQEDKGEHHRSNSMNKKCDAEEVARALEMQMDVQRELQLRIEAQGKYLQSVLKKAQKSVGGCSSCWLEGEKFLEKNEDGKRRESSMDWRVKKNIDLNSIDLNCNALQLFGSTI